MSRMPTSPQPDRGWGLKAKLTASMLLVGVVPLVVGLGMAFWQGSREIREVSGESFEALATEAARKLDLLVAEEIARVPAGATLSVSQLRSRLAKRFGAERTCPLMTGMFVKILAGVVAEDLAQRRQPRWPVWRLVNDNGTLSTTWPLGALYRATRLREERVKLGRRAGAWQVLPTEAG